MIRWIDRHSFNALAGWFQQGPGAAHRSDVISSLIQVNYVLLG
jgi:hypothetical protein